MLYDAGMSRPPGFPTLALAALALGILSLAGPAARADIPPSCDSKDSLITCSATDVGKPCQGGGQCFEISCGVGTTAGKVYKCDACPTIIATPADTCTISKLGMACSGADGGTGTCGVVSAYCAGAGGKFVCQTPATATPTGPPSTGAAGTSGGAAGTTGAAGSTGAAGTTGTVVKSDSGCDVVPKPGKPTLIGVGLVVAGIAFFLIDRARRRSR